MPDSYENVNSTRRTGCGIVHLDAGRHSGTASHPAIATCSQAIRTGSATSGQFKLAPERFKFDSATGQSAGNAP